MKESYKRKLPHIQYPGDTFFITFRLNNSIPQHNLQELKYDYNLDFESLSNIKDGKVRNKKLFERRKTYLLEIDDVLDKIKTGPHYLSDHDIAKIVTDAIHRLNEIYFHLIAYTIMSNHVHILIDTSIQLEHLEYKNERIEKEYINLDQIMKLIKGRSARYANLKLGRSGKFWEKENYDIFMRNAPMMKNVIKYILNNPVKVGLVNNARDYRYNYYYEWETSQ